MNSEMAKRAVEALLFAYSEPLTIKDMEKFLPDNVDIQAALDELREDYRSRGVHLNQSEKAYSFRTAPDLKDIFLTEMIVEKKLGRAATETLAIIAYHQPVTRAEIEAVRGVAVSKGTLDHLLSLEWIRIDARRETPGRPVTFSTTNAFLDNFDLKSVKDLPGIKELRESGLLENHVMLTSSDEAGTDDENEHEAQERLDFEDEGDNAHIS